MKIEQNVIKRKLIHFIFGNLFAILFLFYQKFMTIFFALAIISSAIFTKYIKDAERVFWYFLGVAIISAFYLTIHPKIIASAMLITANGDVFSALFGMKFGKKKIPLSSKTYIGTFSAFLFSFIPVFILIKNFYIALIGAFVGAIVEAYSPLNDNFTVPIFSFIAIYLAYII